MKGIIYKIVCNETGEVYYGSTQQSLKVRMAGHKSKCKAWKEAKYHYVTSFSIIERGNYSYSLIETVECETKQQLEVLERKYIKHNDCINRNIPAMTDKEHKEYQDAYYKDNKDKHKERQKIYNENNKEHLREQNKAYREANRDTIKEYCRVWREANRERRNEQNRAKAKQLKELTQ